MAADVTMPVNYAVNPLPLPLPGTILVIFCLVESGNLSVAKGVIVD